MGRYLGPGLTCGIDNTGPEQHFWTEGIWTFSFPQFEVTGFRIVFQSNVTLFNFQNCILFQSNVMLFSFQIVFYVNPILYYSVFRIVCYFNPKFYYSIIRIVFYFHPMLCYSIFRIVCYFNSKVLDRGANLDRPCGASFFLNFCSGPFRIVRASADQEWRENRKPLVSRAT